MIHKLTFLSEAYADPTANRGLTMPEGHRGPVPRGHALAVKLIGALQAQSWKVLAHWASDYSHAFEARGGGGRFDVMVTCRDTATSSWEVTVETRTGLFRWLRRKFPATLQRLARDVQAVLAADPEISGLRCGDGAATLAQEGVQKAQGDGAGVMIEPSVSLTAQKDTEKLLRGNHGEAVSSHERPTGEAKTEK